MIIHNFFIFLRKLKSRLLNKNNTTNMNDLYFFLIEDFGFKVLEEKTDNEKFGNRITLLVKGAINLTYVIDRGNFSIYIEHNKINEIEPLNVLIVRDIFLNKFDFNKKMYLREEYLQICNSFLEKNLLQVIELMETSKFKLLLDSYIKEIKQRKKNKIKAE